jgi:hypothetical protein
MTTHKVIVRLGAYRIEATSATGKRWLLVKVYPTEEAAMVRLRALQAMARADMPEDDWAARGRVLHDELPGST